MAKKPGDNSTTVTNRDLFILIQKLDKKVDANFEALKPYVQTWDDVRSAGRIGGYVIGFLMSIGAFYLMIVNIFKQ